jgi:hypothetical protein
MRPGSYDQTAVMTCRQPDTALALSLSPQVLPVTVLIGSIWMPLSRLVSDCPPIFLTD